MYDTIFDIFVVLYGFRQKSAVEYISKIIEVSYHWLCEADVNAEIGGC